MASSYANGFFGYLPPTHAFPQGGYEVGWAGRLGLREDMQDRMWEAMEGITTQYALPGHAIRNTK
jgi:hypothetical protein